MIVGIVGSEAAKFTPRTEQRAKSIIRDIIISSDSPTTVVSGACHLGGIDVWAAEIGKEMGCKVIEFAPNSYSWARGFKPRNEKIAGASDIVHCITLRELPDTYYGMRFGYCYHCRRNGVDTEHIKSGGCWTMHLATKLGKQGKLWVIA